MIFPIVRLLLHAAWINFETCFQHLFLRIQMSVIVSFFITLGVRRDMTCSRSCDQRKLTKKGLKDNQG